LTNSFIHLADKKLNMPLPKEAIDFPLLTDFMLAREIRIPEFQRAIVWNAESVEKLLDSIMEGYPIGFFLFWTSKECLQEREPHPLNLRITKIRRNETKYWLLDGQQRATAIVGSFTDRLFLGKGKNNKHQAFFDLKERKFKVLKVTDFQNPKAKPENKVEDWFVPLHKLFLRDRKSGKFILEKEKYLQADPEVLRKYGEHYNNELHHLERMFSNLSIPIINERAHLAEACDIFFRLNTSGTPLGLVDIMVAKTYSIDFLLRDKLDEIDQMLKNELGYRLRDTTILQCMAACLKADTQNDTIIDNADDIKKYWVQTTEAIKQAVVFLKEKGAVCKSRKLLPHEIMVAPLSYYYYKRAQLESKPSGVEFLNALKRYFWYGILSKKYVKSQNTAAYKDMQEMNVLLNDNYDVFKDTNYAFSWLTAKSIREEEISSSPFAKAILCFYASLIPENYNDKSKVKIEEAIDVQNLRSLHHVFPKAVYKGEKEIDSMANISIISTALNSSIRVEKPKSYFARFSAPDMNPDLKNTLRDHHLIGDLTEFGINGDNFPLFIEKRSNLIFEEMQKMICDLKYRPS